MDTWSKAPWLCRDAVEVAWLCAQYTDENGWLPCSVPLGALNTLAWLRCFCVWDSDLSQDSCVSLVGVHRAFAASVLVGLSRFWTFLGVSRELGIGTFQYRTVRKVEYVARLAVFDNLLMFFWADVTDMDDRDLYFAKLQLSVDFRHLEKSGLLYWTNYVCHECRVRATTGYAVPYQYVMQIIIAAAKRKGVNAKLTLGWSLIKVPMGCFAELLPIFSYKGSALMDPR